MKLVHKRSSAIALSYPPHPFVIDDLIMKKRDLTLTVVLTLTLWGTKVQYSTKESILQYNRTL